MASIPTFSIRPSFLGAGSNPAGARVVIAGVPFDIGTTNRSGARFGPAAVRQASRMLVDGANPCGWADPPNMAIADIGDFAIALGETKASLELIERQAAAFDHLVAIGGDHGITLALLRALRKKRGTPLALVHFDAHVDTWPDCFGQTYGHGSVFRHAIAEGLVDPRRMIQIGIRSPVQKEVWEWTVAQGVTILTAEDVHTLGVPAAVEEIRSTIGDAAAYLSFDIDAIDPGQAPGTGTPEVGGLFTWQVSAILRRLGDIRWAGADVVEVLPAHDVSEITSLAAATVVWQYLSLLEASA